MKDDAPEPTSAAAPGASPDSVIDTTAEVGDRQLTELVDAWISAMNRIPKFLQIVEAPGTPLLGGEELPSTAAMGGLLGVLSRDLTSLSVPSPPSLLVLFNRRVVHPWWIRRRMVQEAVALGLERRFARVLALRFEKIWRSGETHMLSRKEQTARIVELLRAP